jgi:hypothetical protein
MVKIGGNDFLSQLMHLAAEERDLQPGQHGKQGFCGTRFGIPTMGIGDLI